MKPVSPKLSILLMLLVIIMSSKAHGHQNIDEPDDDKDSYFYLFATYNTLISDYYGIGLRQGSIILEAGYGGFFGKKKYTTISESALEALLDDFNSRYGTNVSGSSKVKQPHWNLALAYSPKAIKNIYFGASYSSITIKISETAFTGDENTFLNTRNSTADLIAGYRFSGNTMGLGDKLYFDLRVGYGFLVSSKVVATPEIFNKLKNDNPNNSDLHNFLKIYEDAIKSEPIQYIDNKLFFGISIVFSL